MDLIIGAALLTVILAVAVLCSLRLGGGLRILPDRVFLALFGWILVLLVALILPVVFTVITFELGRGHRTPLAGLVVLSLPLYCAIVTWLALGRADRDLEQERQEEEGGDR